MSQSLGATRHDTQQQHLPQQQRQYQQQLYQQQQYQQQQYQQQQYQHQQQYQQQRYLYHQQQQVDLNVQDIRKDVAGDASKKTVIGLINHPSKYQQLEMDTEVTMLGTGDSVSKDRISALAKEVVSGAKSNPFQAAPTFTMQVDDDLIRVQSKAGDARGRMKRSAPNAALDEEKETNAKKQKTLN
jgi:hypothetical protein